MAGKNIDYERLTQSMRYGRKVLEHARRERRDAVEMYAGPHWSDTAPRQRVPIPLLSLYLAIVGRALVPKNPRFLLSTFQHKLKPTVNAMQDWMNTETEGMRLDQTLRRIIIDGLFSVGIAKVALATPPDAAKFSWQLKAGAPFCERVDLDDVVLDMRARDFHEAAFVGHRYRVPLDVVKDSKIYSAARKKLEPTTDQPYNIDGDERVTHLGRGQYTNFTEDEFEDMVDLWEVYLPRHRCVVTLADDQMLGVPGAGVEPLREQEWIGIDSGPYVFLGYGWVPGNAMPKGPLMDLVDLHEFVNRTFRKLMRQTDRQKENTFVRGGATEDGERVMQGDDGEILRVDNPQDIITVSRGGPNAQNLAMFTAAKDLFSYFGGNLDMMGGLSPQSKTATQDKLLAENASRTLMDLQDATIDFIAEVGKALGWYWLHDPYRTMRTSYALPGLSELSIPRKVGPEKRLSIRWADLDMKVDPYSLQHSTPQRRQAAIDQTLATIAPFLPLLGQQGIGIDLNAYLQKRGEYLDMPDLAEIFAFQEAPQPDTEQADLGSAPPGPDTERRYVRENVPARTRMGDDQNMVNSLMGIDQGGANTQSNGQAKAFGA